MGTGRLLIFATSKEQQDKILKKTTLNGHKITSHIPGVASKSRGVISGVSTSVSVEEIKKNLKGGNLVDAKRLTKGKEKAESLSVLLLFKQEKPSKVQLGYTSYPVRVFIPHPLRCFKCQRFGHVATQSTVQG